MWLDCGQASQHELALVFMNAEDEEQSLIVQPKTK